MARRPCWASGGAHCPAKGHALTKLELLLVLLTGVPCTLPADTEVSAGAGVEAVPVASRVGLEENAPPPVALPGAGG